MLVCCFVFAGVQAQKITHEYNNVSLSEALRQLNEQTEDYNISFLYNDLEDFRITTSIRRKSVPDAIRQMIGFYPIRMTIEDREIMYLLERGHQMCCEEPCIHRKSTAFHNGAFGKGNPTSALLALELSTTV